MNTFEILANLAADCFETINAILGSAIAEQGYKEYELDLFPEEQRMNAFLDFSGTKTGFLAISFKEQIAADLLEVGVLPAPDERREMRSEYGDFFKEVLNTAAGNCLSSLQSTFGAITGLTPKIVFGTVSFSRVRCQVREVQTEAGTFYFILSIDEARLQVNRLREKLQESEKRLTHLLAETTQAYQETESRYLMMSLALKNINDSVCIMDIHERILFTNSAFTRNYGYEEHEILGENCDMLWGGGLRTAELKQILLANGGGSWTGECYARHKNQHEFPISLSMSTLRDDNGKPTAIVAVARDISNQKRVERQLKQSRDEAEANTRAKSEFLANMSHEIRTPMNGILGMNRLLLESGLSGEQEEFAKSIQFSASSLLNLINDILDFSKIEAGKLELEILEFDLVDTVESTVDMIALKAQEKGLEVLIDIDPAVQRRYQGDPSRIRQILLNFLSNAVKFTDEGEIRIEVDLAEASAKDNLIRFSVVDSGIGIPENKQSLVFESFAQADGTTSRKYGGTGLGLAISRQLAEMMGGGTGLSSVPEHGSTFWFTARFEAGPESAQQAELLPAGWQQDSPPRILIVDNNRSSSQILMRILEVYACEIETIRSGEGAAKRVELREKSGRPFDMVIWNGQAPSLEEDTHLAAMQQLDVTQRPELIVFISMMQRVSRELLDRLGVRFSLRKPIKRDQLLEAITKALSQDAELTSIAERFIDGEEDSASPDEDIKLRILMAEDNVINQKVACRFLEKMGHQVDVVGNGFEAVELASRISYDVILMDMMMPEMDGVEATMLIRSREKINGGHVPIIALTANAMTGDRERCLEAGMDDYVSKPVNFTHLKNTINALLKSGQSDEAVTA